MPYERELQADEMLQEVIMPRIQGGEDVNETARRNRPSRDDVRYGRAGWECPQCGLGGTVSRGQEEDILIMGSARCPGCYGAVRVVKGAGL